MTKTRRPMGCRNDPDGPEPETDFRTFLYKEDAAEVAKTLIGWQTHVQFSAYHDRWLVECQRKSWGYCNPALLHKDGSIKKVV